MGVGFQFEQEVNLEMLVRAGMGIRIPLRAFSGERVLTEAEREMNNAESRQNVA